MAGDEKISNITKQNVILENRRTLHVSGVKEVTGFDENYVLMQTQLGELEIRGEGLRVSELSVDTGGLLVEGSIAGVNYLEKAEKVRLWEKLFG